MSPKKTKNRSEFSKYSAFLTIRLCAPAGFAILQDKSYICSNMETALKLIADGSTIKVEGVLDGIGADGLVTAMNADTIYTLDFGGVSEIKFAALRTLLNFRKSGKHFSIINASDSVAERFEDTGVSCFIGVCRKPKQLVLGQYDEFGASFLSKAYNSEDGDSMIKVYGERIPSEVVFREKMTARAVMLFGLPTPLVGTIYQEGGNTALDFERIEGKRSFSRIIFEEPDRLEEISVRFAKMCKKLHETPCDTNVFPDRKIHYREAVSRCKELSETEKAKVLAFIDNIPDETTCLHGDMQISNVITNGKEDLWIDLSDFSYGCPMLDMGMWYFLCKLNSEKTMLNLFRLDRTQMGRVWDAFSEEYFGADTPEKKAEVERMVLPYASLHMLYLGATYFFEPFMLEYLRKTLLA